MFLSLSLLSQSLSLSKYVCSCTHYTYRDFYAMYIYIYMVYANRNIISCTHLSIYLSTYIYICAYRWIMDLHNVKCRFLRAVHCQGTQWSHISLISLLWVGGLGRWTYLRGATTSFCQWSGSSLLARPPAIQRFMESICGPGCCAPNSARESQTA